MPLIKNEGTDISPHAETRKTYRAVLSEPTLIMPVLEPEAQASTLPPRTDAGAGENDSGIAMNFDTNLNHEEVPVPPTPNAPENVVVEQQDNAVASSSSGSKSNSKPTTNAAVKNKRPRETGSGNSSSSNQHQQPPSQPTSTSEGRTLDERQHKKKKRRKGESASGTKD